MKNSLQFSLLACLCLLSSISLKAADLVVNTGGAGGTYASIGAALTAAASGDRIIVYPQLNNAAYFEGTITINKSIQILSANEGAFYAMDGHINITPATAGINVTIIGMKFSSGYISATIASPAGARSNINILNDSLMAGGIELGQNNYNLTVASNYINGQVNYRYGKVLGNVIQSSVNIASDAVVGTDTVMVIGNKITYGSASQSGAISWNSTSHFFAFQNNFITITTGANGYNYGIHVQTSKSSLAGTNTVLNNTVYKNTSNGTINYGYPITTAAVSNTDVQNNLLLATLSSWAYSFGGGNINAHYNYATNFNWTGMTNDGTNIQAVNTTINTTSGVVNNPLSNTINGGTTDSAYADLDLTRNDAGCYGGSYSLDNFFPITANDWARVILVTAPRRIMVNGTINVKAIGFDK